MTKAKKKLITRKRQGRKTAKPAGKPRPYVLPKTAAELGIVCTADRNGSPCNLPVIWFDYEIGEKSHMQGFVCDDHRISDRVEKLAQPPAASTT
jgi:hypothetical protein